MKILIGSDEAGFSMKTALITLLTQRDYDVRDFGVYDTSPSLYPDTAFAVAQAVKAEPDARGILICGTGIGMSIVANKVPGIRAAVCHDIFSTERSRKSNNAQIMCLGARVIALELAKRLVDIWLNCEFEGGGSIPKMERIADLENRSGRL
jgi:ribose 5-phosphate isomerase B